MKKISYCIVSHTVISKNNIDNAGPAHTISYYLEKQQQPFLFIRHSIYLEGVTLVTYFDGISKKEEVIPYKVIFGEIGARIWEGWLTFKLISRFLDKDQPVYIGVDPLNTVWGLLLKKLRRVKMLIAFSPDYTKSRYSNAFLNMLYHFLDKLTVRNADLVLAVSNRILDIRRSDGISDNKLIWLPNSPSIARTRHLVSKVVNPFKLIVVSTRKSVDEFTMLLNAIGNLSKEFPGIKLTFVCLPIMEKELKALVKKRRLDHNITFLGAMSHDKLFRTIADYGIGIAFYINSYPGEYYIDSMKARDYLALGLPVIISGDNGTAEDIEKNKAGLHINANEKELVKAIRELIVNKQLYSEFRVNALKLAKVRDSERVLDELFNKININSSIYYKNNILN